MNTYYDELKRFQTKIEFYTKEIFKVYGNELQLKLEDYNLLSNEKNCIESSTSTGFIIEEFIVSKLETYTKSHKLPDEYQILRTDGSTTTSSYDCYSKINSNIKALINVKICKGANNAVAAINALYNDYVVTNPEQTKCFMILKIHYHFEKSRKDNQRKIFITKVESYFLEEVDFSYGHKQDHRNWSQNFNPNSGRLQVTDKDRRNLVIAEPSYNKTFDFIDSMVNEKKDETKYKIHHVALRKGIANYP